jgi:hypothetical protein
MEIRFPICPIIHDHSDLRFPREISELASSSGRGKKEMPQIAGCGKGYETAIRLAVALCGQDGEALGGKQFLQGLNELS